MSNSRSDVLAAARAILAEHSLADLTMRRLATDLGVRPNALYWHFPNKQTMLAALADDILDAVAVPAEGSAPERIRRVATAMRAALLAVPDSAEIVSSAWASGLSARSTVETIVTVASDGGLDDRTAAGVATAVCQLTIGLTIEEQTRTQMERLGVTGPSGRDFDGEFEDGLDVIVSGARARTTLTAD
ncbi:TetR family transcriptional regulator [Gordonia sp. HY285]|uniref:TetR family transcriptional regulator n=1 Tax=Gordonia liuliyuniae TaxID=2911517 RepID=UPI001F01103F|nr:TetR family transcriptional regulator [Gordonia liuliyuniae]MCF8611215.1 TetR family transcriptional regulator [Gordonia liuliyuniae]